MIKQRRGWGDVENDWGSAEQTRHQVTPSGGIPKLGEVVLWGFLPCLEVMLQRQNGSQNLSQSQDPPGHLGFCEEKPRSKGSTPVSLRHFESD